MRARVKETGEIIEVQDCSALMRMQFKIAELEEEINKLKEK